jgi:pilus assembly protein Flp/PilA
MSDELKVTVENEVSAVEEKKERGASMVEYALLVALIAVISIVAIRTVGQQVSENFSEIQSELSSANANGGSLPTGN